MLRRLQLMPDISRGLSIIHADEGSNGVPFSSFHTLPASFPIFLREENIFVDTVLDIFFQRNDQLWIEWRFYSLDIESPSFWIILVNFLLVYLLLRIYFSDIFVSCIVNTRRISKFPL